MKTDSLFYRLFETSPETLFLLLGMPTESALATAARYQYQAIEFKETSHRVDGVFLPKELRLPLYFLEVQFYRLSSVFADLLAKVYTYLKHHEPGQPFVGVILFADRSLEPKEIEPYKPLLEAGLIKCFYLDEMPELANAPLGLSILYLIRQAESQAPAAARKLVERSKMEVSDDTLRADLIELIETVIIYKIPRLSRQEIQTMLQVFDIRHTRLFQEAKEEGLQEGIEKGREEGIDAVIAKMAAKSMSRAEIAAILDVEVDRVRQVMARTDRE